MQQTKVFRHQFRGHRCQGGGQPRAGHLLAAGPRVSVRGASAVSRLRQGDAAAGGRGRGGRSGVEVSAVPRQVRAGPRHPLAAQGTLHIPVLKAQTSLDPQDNHLLERKHFPLSVS